MRKTLTVAALVLSFGSLPAWASCVYDGTYYEAGARLCFDGWLQECTVADYWSAIGMCRAPDASDQRVDSRPLADRLFAMAQDIAPEPEAPQSAVNR